MSKRCLMLKGDDNVALALEDLAPGDLLQADGIKVTMRQPVEFGHKFAVRGIKKGEAILKHGEIIGRATSDIEAGEHVHVHNVESLRAKKERK